MPDYSTLQITADYKEKLRKIAERERRSMAAQVEYWIDQTYQEDTMDTTSFQDFDEAADYARKNKLPLWDTGQLPDRYLVGHLDAETEENEELTEVFLDD